MPKGPSLRNEILKFVFQDVAMTSIGASAYISLHTADPAEGNQSSYEANYTSYERVAIARDTDSWTTATAGVTSNNVVIQFPMSTGGTNVVTHVGIGTDASGSGTLLYSGELTSSLEITDGVQPQFSVGSLVIEEV